MNNTKFKDAFNAVSPDAYMESRIWENIKDKKKKRFPLKAVISCALAFAVVSAGAGGIYYKNTFTDRPFSVMVVSASDQEVITATLGTDDVAFPQVNISNYIDEYGDNAVQSQSDGGFSVCGNDIASVRYESKNGELYYYDQMKMLYDMWNGTYYLAVIPVTDDDAETINKQLNAKDAESVFKEYYSNHDISPYTDDKLENLNNYQVEFLKCSDVIGYSDMNGYAFFITDLSKNKEYFNIDQSQKLTVNMYDIPRELLEKYYSDEELKTLTNVIYFPDEASTVLMDNPDMDKSKLPADEVTITVTFKDGKKARKTVNVSFDKDGVAQFVMK